MKNVKFILLTILFSLICSFTIFSVKYLSSVQLRDNLVRFQDEYEKMNELMNDVLFPEFDSFEFSFKPCLREKIGYGSVIKSYDLRYYNENRAKDILIKSLTILLDKNENFLHYPSANLKKLLFSEAVQAFEFDLNNDGVKEVLGLVKSWKYNNQYGTMPFFVFQKQGDEYEKIGLFQYHNEQKIVIFKEQINGYHNMQFRNDDFIPCERFQFDENFYITMSFRGIYVPH